MCENEERVQACDDLCVLAVLIILFLCMEITQYTAVIKIIGSRLTHSRV